MFVPFRLRLSCLLFVFVCFLCVSPVVAYSFVFYCFWFVCFIGGISFVAIHLVISFVYSIYAVN